MFDAFEEILIAVIIGGGILVFVFAAAYAEWRKKQWIVRQLRRLFRDNPLTLPIVTRQFPSTDFPNIQRALDDFSKRPGVSRAVIGFEGYTLRQLGYGAGAYAQAIGRKCALRYVDVDIGYDQQMQCMENGLHLITARDGKLAVFVAAAQVNSGSLSIEVMAASADSAAQFINHLRDEAARRSVYRGKVISLEPRSVEGEPGFVNVRFHSLPRIARGDIILPSETLALVERNSTSFFRHADTLRRSGRSLKRGLLLHGMPGTGKTLTAKWLATSLENVTVILLSGEQLWHVKECCQLARLLAPSLIIMEDVDLIAEERQASSHHTALHQLLNEMDGLESDAEVIFVLTTNRPEVIEPALSGRPGRVDQAIHFPLPDAECRRRLFALYGKGLDLAAADVGRLVARTDGASPAFIKELVRKAALISAEECGDGDGCLRLSDAHFAEALRELTIGGGRLSRELLGFHAANQSLEP